MCTATYSLNHVICSLNSPGHLACTLALEEPWRLHLYSITDMYVACSRLSVVGDERKGATTKKTTEILEQATVTICCITITYQPLTPELHCFHQHHLGAQELWATHPLRKVIRSHLLFNDNVTPWLRQVFRVEVVYHLKGLITVFVVILTGRQSGQKLQCLYGNPIANNFFQIQLNFSQCVNQNINLPSPSLKDVAFL